MVRVISTDNILIANGGTGNTSATAYSLICGGTTTTGAFQGVADVATGQVLVSGGVSALPAFSSTPTLTSVTFGAGTALSTYAEGTFNPTIAGASTAGTTTYTLQSARYVKIGKLVWIQGYVTWTAATGTGVIQVGGLPFTIDSASSAPHYPAISIDSNLAIATATWVFGRADNGNTYFSIFGSIQSTGVGVNSSLAANTNNTIQFSGMYIATT